MSKQSVIYIEVFQFLMDVYVEAGSASKKDKSHCSFTGWSYVFIVSMKTRRKVIETQETTDPCISR